MGKKPGICPTRRKWPKRKKIGGQNWSFWSGEQTKAQAKKKARRVREVRGYNIRVISVKKGKGNPYHSPYSRSRPKYALYSRGGQKRKVKDTWTWKRGWH